MDTMSIPDVATPPVTAAAPPQAYPFHRLNRSVPKSTWWKPIVTGLIAVAFFAVFAGMLLVIAFVIAALDPEAAAQFDPLITSGIIDTSQPYVLAFSLASIIIMLPALLLATLIMGPRPLGLLSSVGGRLRWGWMLRLAAPAAAVFFVIFGLWMLVLPVVFGEPMPMPEWGPRSAALIAVTLLLVPLQATAEEYVFRGYLMQLIGTWLKHPAWAILLPVPLFVAGHLYDMWGLIDVGVFAVFAGWITWRTGGLEAAIVAHVINNALLFVLSAIGLVDTNATEGSPLGVAVTLITLGLFSWWVLALQRRHGIARERLVDAQP
jgi:membrane protease YdiL (CAAX protease family)